MESGVSSPNQTNTKTRKLTQEEYYRELHKWISNIRRIHVMLRYYLNIEPYELELWEWAHRYKELEWIRKEETKGGKYG